jgi:hypothetical protein
MLIEFPLPFIDLLLAQVQRGLPPVSLPFPLVSRALPLVSRALPLVSQGLALVSFAFALIRYALALFCRALALIRRALAPSDGLTLNWRSIPRPGGCLPSCHTLRMHRYSPDSSLRVEVLGTMTDGSPELCATVCNGVPGANGCQLPGVIYRFRSS